MECGERQKHTAEDEQADEQRGHIVGLPVLSREGARKRRIQAAKRGVKPFPRAGQRQIHAAGEQEGGGDGEDAQGKHLLILKQSELLGTNSLSQLH